VTSAALVILVALSIFATLSALDMKRLGVGLAGAVVLDATVVRTVLLQASMKLLGRWSWYPRPSLPWRPRHQHDGATLPAAESA
jgi:RND superfamily putative drug exporter